VRALSIAWKDVRHVYRNVAGLAMMLIAPLALAFALGAAFGGMDTGFSIAATKTMVVNEDAGAGAGMPSAGATIVSALTSEGLADLLTVTTVATADAARAAVDNGEVGVAVIIPQGFSTALMTDLGSASSPVVVEVYKDPTLTVGPAIAQAVVDSVVQSLNGARATAAATVQLAATAGITDMQAIANLAAKSAQAFALASEKAPIALDQRSPQVAEGKSREPNVGSQVLVGMMTFFMLFGASVPARSILDEHREGTLSRLFTTPTPRGIILGGKYIAVFLVVLIQAVILLVAGRLLMGAHWGPIGPVIVLALCTALVAASLGLFCVSFAKTPAQAGAVSSAIFVFLGLVSGNFFGGVNVGGTLATVRRVSPLGWLHEGWGNLMYGGSWGNVWLPMVVALGFALVFFALSTFFFRRRYA
jgi:ABC-2 type transport system permease protein